MSDKERLINKDASMSISGYTPQEHGTFDRVIRPMAAEFVGVALFVFVACCSLNSGDLVAAALGHGLTIALLVVGFGAISGAHFNPAVTLGVTLGGGLPVSLLPGYWIAQLGGGILGAAIVRGTLPSSVYASISGGTHQLGKEVTAGWGFLIEVVLTTVLVLTVLMAAVNRQTKSKLAPLAIGFAVSVDIMAGLLFASPNNRWISKQEPF
ncbi:aquaporin-8-like isoform X2 [Dreissena polymorpha]|uniref:aquaporin-8-like isoform X2 n=1 Tax=Dreissena polymorpha TaxID=45954 RepID=UPI002263CA50|nr:aquaporin-8-like isoform X2 [Dreissena polymorpha]